MTLKDPKAIFDENFGLGGEVEKCQARILAVAPKFGRYLNFSLGAATEPRPSLLELAKLADGNSVVVGVGQPTVVALGKTIAELRPFPTNLWQGADFIIGWRCDAR